MPACKHADIQRWLLLVDWNDNYASLAYAAMMVASLSM